MGMNSGSFLSYLTAPVKKCLRRGHWKLFNTSAGSRLYLISFPSANTVGMVSATMGMEELGRFLPILQGWKVTFKIASTISKFSPPYSSAPFTNTVSVNEYVNDKALQRGADSSNLRRLAKQLRLVTLIDVDPSDSTTRSTSSTLRRFCFEL